MSDTLLLNANYLPLEVITWKRALTLVYEEVAVPITFYEDWVVASVNEDHKVPAVVALRKMIDFDAKIKFSRENVYIRDKFRCQYCGETFKSRDLELEHVVPQSRGGRTCFENIVSTCRPCNHQKANRTPEEAGMRLLRKPSRPSHLHYAMYKVARSMRHESWSDYAGMYSSFRDINQIEED